MSNSEAKGNTTQASPQPKGHRLSWWFVRLVPPLLILCSGLIVIVAIGVAQRVGWLSGGGATPAATSTGTSQVYTCPMHPQIRQPVVGRCPICGMELVPAAVAGANDLSELSVKIEPAQRRLANIQTAEVGYEPIFATIRTVGSIAIDESRMATIASYVDGRIERLFADYTGVRVAEGDHLAVVYSPELYTAQVEYLEHRRSLASLSTALDAVREARTEFVVNARRKLQELGLQERQIQELERTNQANSRQTIFTPIGGTVIEKLAVEGKYVKAGEPIYRIADLSTVWLKLELYPEDASRIRFGQVVQARVSSLPNQIFKGRVAFIDPTVDSRKRAVGVRVEFLNDEGRLRPGDYADATIILPIDQEGEVYDAELAGKWISPMHPQVIRDEPGPCPICGMDLVSTTRYGYSKEPVEQTASLFVPRSALLMAGQNSVVYVEAEPGRFEIRPVTLGPLLRDRAVVLTGLEAGEKVATAGNFLIDSQMQLAGKPSLIDPTKAIASATERNEPLEFSHIHVASVEGQPGTQLETLFATYFRIHQSLAADKTPNRNDTNSLFTLATQLNFEASLPPDARAQLSIIAKQSERMHELDLDRARHDAFRPISHAVVALATIARGSQAQEPFQHMFCPMVKGGAGDWLQADDRLLNPYWGSGMLRCGDIVRSVPTRSDHAQADRTEEVLESDAVHGEQP